MSDYTKSTNFAAKDALASGNAAKVVKGTEIDTEFNNIATAIATKTDDSSAAITGGTIDGTAIGGTTPAAGAFTTLSASGVSSFADGSASAPAITNTGDTNTGIFFPAADTIAFATNGTEDARFDSTGNFGLGVTPSAWVGYKAFEFVSAGTALWSAGAGDARLSSNTYYNGGYKFAATGVRAGLYNIDTSGTHSWNISTASGTAGSAITFTQAMTLDASGNLLVGATSSGSRRLYVAGSNAGYITSTENANASPFGLQIYYSAAAPNGTSNQFIECVDSSATRFRVLSNGNAQNTNNSYGAISDVKLKENITDATPKLTQLNQVRVVNYNFIGDEYKQLGVIAQELEQIFPAMVEEIPDHDSDGNDLGTTTKSVKYSVFVPMLIKAIQEQQAIIEQLTNRITALEAK